MRNLRIGKMTVALAVALASCAAFASSALAFTEFEATGTLPTNILSKSISTNQEFTAEAGGVKVVCTALSSSGQATQAKITDMVITITYTGCTALFQTVDNIVVEYLFEPNGKVGILKVVVIEILGVANCNIEILAQTLASGATYSNNGKNLKVIGNASGIESEGKGGSCGTKLSKTGTYKGEAESSLENGGTLSVK
jgi:hypothetical protein